MITNEMLISRIENCEKEQKELKEELKVIVSYCQTAEWAEKTTRVIILEGRIRAYKELLSIN